MKLMIKSYPETNKGYKQNFSSIKSQSSHALRLDLFQVSYILFHTIINIFLEMDNLKVKYVFFCFEKNIYIPNLIIE